MKIVKWIDCEKAVNKDSHGLGGFGGFFKKGMRWKDYKKMYKKTYHKELEELRKSIIENRIRCKGSEHQYGNGNAPLWDDGSADTYSYRGWGDLMAAVWSTEDNVDYSYMDFYC